MFRFEGPENICPSMLIKLLFIFGFTPNLNGSYYLYEVGNFRSADDKKPP